MRRGPVRWIFQRKLFSNSEGREWKPYLEDRSVCSERHKNSPGVWCYKSRWTGVFNSGDKVDLPVLVQSSRFFDSSTRNGTIMSSAVFRRINRRVVVGISTRCQVGVTLQFRQRKYLCRFKKYEGWIRRIHSLLGL